MKIIYPLSETEYKALVIAYGMTAIACGTIFFVMGIMLFAN